MTKYSIKNICLGIGLGLIISSMANISTAPGSISVDDIRREAAKHNLIVMDAKEIIQKQPAETSKENKEDTVDKQQVEDVIIEVKSGATSETIADQLLNNKLIESKKAFLDRLKEMKRENRLQIGTFKIPAASTLDEVINIITSTPK